MKRKRIWHEQFSEWHSAEVEAVFGLRRVENLVALTDWLAEAQSLGPAPTESLERLREELLLFVNRWNEIELLARFIGPLLGLVRFWGPGYNLYHHRPLRLDFNGQTTSGTVDGLVASGVVQPETPYFFLHEYKKAQGYEADPLGQLLVAMCAAQALNTDGHPLYGCYIVGRFWSFVLLAGQQYAGTQGYDATDAGELHTIWRLLVAVKSLIEARVAAED